MGIDLSRMKEKLSRLQNGGRDTKQKNVFWRPNDGEQTIRIVPTADGDPFKEYWFHYNLGDNNGFLSPKKNFGEDDPLNDFIRSLWSEGTEDSIKMAKELSARQRFFAPIIVRGEEDQGVRIWGFGKTVYEQLLTLVLNPEYGDITDPKEGTDLTLQYGKPVGASFPTTRLIPHRRTSPVCPNISSEECAALLKSVPDFNTLFERKTAAQVQAMLDQYLAGDNPEEASSETAKYGNDSSKKKASNSVEAAFNDLLGD